ncbi:hypothetical protein EAF04_007793 [Stromatinia cepivora]|nr:hypothetical protein EAF04_007793 [Stromatinia cepivora]
MSYRTNPFIVTWIPNDAGDPQNFRPAIKWLVVPIDVIAMLATTFDSSALSGGIRELADMFSPSQRGLAMPLIAVAPFLGPTIGPIAGAIFPSVMWIVGVLIIPETYKPVLLRKRSHALSKMTGQVYRTKEDSGEQIVLILSIYMSITYGTLYMLFGAYPIVYQEVRGWSEGIGALPFLGITIGTISASPAAPLTQKAHMRAAALNGGFAHPEAHLVPAMIGAIVLPIGLFWFAWTNSPSIHWISSVMAGVPFGFRMVIVFIAVFNYLIDTYAVFAASALAANSVLRSLFGFAFPLFTQYMFDNLGIHWASLIPAFLALACVPAPFVFCKYGAVIRAHCVWIVRSEAIMKSMRARAVEREAVVTEDKTENNADEEKT